MGVYIWSIVMQVKFDAQSPGNIDWDDSLYPSAFLPYFFVQTTGPLSQSYMYWLISSFATDAQSNVRNGAAFRYVHLPGGMVQSRTLLTKSSLCSCIEAVGQAVSYGVNSNANTSTLVGL